MLKQLRNNLIFLATSAAEKKANGRDITSKLDEGLDKKLGKKISEKIQRGPGTQFLRELIEGFWLEDLSDLSTYLEEWAADLDTEVLLTSKKKGHRR